MNHEAHKLDRRSFDRFAIERDVTYTILDTKYGNEVGVGKTVNMSSTGIRFSSEHFLLPGVGVQLMINWPSIAKVKAPGKLFAQGHVVGCSNGTAFMEIQNFELHNWSPTDPKLAG